MSNPRPVPASLLQSAVDGLTYDMERDGFTIPNGYKMQVRVLCVPMDRRCKDGSKDVCIPAPPRMVLRSKDGTWERRVNCDGDNLLASMLREFLPFSNAESLEFAANEAAMTQLSVGSHVLLQRCDGQILNRFQGVPVVAEPFA